MNSHRQPPLLTPGGKLPDWLRRIETQALRPPEQLNAWKSDRLAALIKRLAADAMKCATECSPAAIPQALARCKDLATLGDFAIANSLVDADERQRSGQALIYCTTLADYCAALRITLAEHRAPVAVCRWDDDLNTINRKLDTIAAELSAQRNELARLLPNQNPEPYACHE